MFDRILDHTRELGLDRAQAKQLLGMLVAQVFNPRRGGPAGFLQAFRDQGLGAEVDSWLGAGPNAPVAADEVERALGHDTLARMADRLGLPVATVARSAAAMLPDAVHELSEHGDLPESAAGVPSGFQGWLGNLQEHLDDLGHWGTAAMNAGIATLGGSVGVVGDMPPVTPAIAPTHEPPASATPARSGPTRPLALIAAALLVAVAAVVLARSCNGAVAVTEPAHPWSRLTA